MSKTTRGRPRTSDPNDTHGADVRRASARYYARNREKILKRAHDTHVPTYVPMYSPPYICEHCGREFKSGTGLGVHLWWRGVQKGCWEETKEALE